MLDKGANFDTADAGGFLPIHVATRDERVEALESFLKHGSDPNKKVSIVCY